jgi:capsular exopolysaccharide synthesis family protein
LSIRDLLRALRRNALLVLVCLLVGLGGGAYLAVTQPASYTTQIRLFVSSNGSDSTDSLLQNSNLVLERVPSYVTLVNSPLVVDKVVKRLRLTESPDSVARRITATNPLQTALIEITVQDTTAQGAYNLALALGDTVTEVVQGIETSATGFAPVKVTTVSQPEMPGRALAGPIWRLGLGLLLGLILGAALAIGRELLDTRLKDPEQLRTKLGLPPLATVAIGTRPAKMPPPTEEAYWATPAGEGFRLLRTNLQVLVNSGGLRSIVVTGPHSDDQADTVARNLAIALSKAKVRVVLIEANLRNPRLAETFGFEGGPGLSAVLDGQADADAVTRQWRDGDLRVLPAGSSSGSSSELLASDAMDHLLGHFERRYDLVIVDAPPVLEVADAAVLATRVDGVLLALRHRGTKWDAVWRSVQALHDVQARVLGAVVLHRAGRLDRAPREAALRVPVAASRWSGPSGGAVPAPRAGEPTQPRAGAERRVRRPLRPVPDLPKPGDPARPGEVAKPAEPKPIVLPGVGEGRADVQARGVASMPQARGVAAVGGSNRAEPEDNAEPDEDRNHA